MASKQRVTIDVSVRDHAKGHIVRDRDARDPHHVIVKDHAKENVIAKENEIVIPERK